VTAAGCASSKHPQARPSAGHSAAVASVAQVRTAMAGVRSYAFRLTVTSRQGDASAVLLAVGRAQAPRRILATVTEAGRSEQVLGTEAGQFAAEPKGAWKPVKGASLQPIAWNALLARTSAAASGHGTLEAALTSTQAGMLGYPAGARFAGGHYTATLDSSHRVTRLLVSMKGTAAGAAVEVTETVTLSGFDRQGAIPVKPPV
jgi:hypothetical protein